MVLILKVLRLKGRFKVKRFLASANNKTKVENQLNIFLSKNTTKTNGLKISCF